MIAIIDYGMGNLASVQKAFNKLGKDSLITNNAEEIKKSKVIVLPGVGAFQQGMKNLEEYNLISVLYEEVMLKKKPFLGICLGMQLIMEKGTEPENCKGLGWVKGSVEPIINKKLSVPHLGWNNVYQENESNEIDNIDNNFYFIHSYHVIPSEPLIKGWVYYEFPIVASLKKENIFATQFHPEKSQDAGLSLLKIFFNSYA
tara:strand:+ start:17 stop:619 length:603 start_codon:yes stop_codon:yes gene_type:complete